MATLRIPEENRTMTEFGAVRAYLAGMGIEYMRWEPSQAVPANAPAAEVLNAYSAEIDRLKAEGRYVAADVIDVSPATPGLEAMLNRFNSEHWHNEDEVRFVIEGRGLFHIRPLQGPVVSITVEAGDLIRVPRGIGSIFARNGAFVQFVFFRIPPVGRHTTRKAAWTRIMSPCASGPVICQHQWL
jgi:1,2-dihydroxy-3-keto-5-methylthiopentene dioxygenase